MKKMNILQRLATTGVVAVIRGDSKEEAVQAAQAVVKGGIVGLELTFTVPNAAEAIQELLAMYRDHSEVVVGAGTVLDATTARLAIMAGAEFVVSPCFDKATAEMCHLYQIPYLPGCMTITEMKDALKSGVDIIKLFPGSAFDPEIVKAFKAPLPQLNLMPTGGVSLENMAAWFQAGVCLVGVGGNLLAPAKTGDFARVTAMAVQYREQYLEIQKDMK